VTARTLRVLSELRDLEIFDSEGELCGICDEVEFDGGPGKPLAVKALLVGPGAYKGRLPGWMAWIAHRVAGEGMVRVPWAEVKHVTSRITLNRRAEELGLAAVERKLRPAIAKLPMAT
jgi:sporulation protein YlmC with PRC-barrel domain